MPDHTCGAGCPAHCTIQEELERRWRDPLLRVKDAQANYLQARGRLEEADRERIAAFVYAREKGEGWRRIGKAAGLHFSTIRELVMRTTIAPDRESSEPTGHGC